MLGKIEMQIIQAPRKSLAALWVVVEQAAHVHAIDRTAMDG
jgi:hypothetical protein